MPNNNILHEDVHVFKSKSVFTHFADRSDKQEQAVFETELRNQAVGASITASGLHSEQLEAV